MLCVYCLSKRVKCVYISVSFVHVDLPHFLMAFQLLFSVKISVVSSISFQHNLKDPRAVLRRRLIIPRLCVPYAAQQNLKHRSKLSGITTVVIIKVC